MTELRALTRVDQCKQWVNRQQRGDTHQQDQTHTERGRRRTHTGAVIYRLHSEYVAEGGARRGRGGGVLGEGWNSVLRPR